MSHSRCFWWQVTEKVTSGGLTNKQNALTHTTGSPEKGHNIVSSKAQLFSPVYCSILIMLLTLLMLKTCCSGLGHCILIWQHPEAEKNCISFMCLLFRIPSLCFFLKTKNPKISPIPIGLLSSFKLLCPFLRQGIAR